MKQLYIAICLIALCSPTFGQIGKGVFRSAKTALSAQSFSSATQHALSRRIYQTAGLHTQITNLLSKSVEPAIFLDLKNPSKMSLVQAAPIYEHYQLVMEQFAQFKQFIGPRLYYQTLPREWNPLTEVERHYLLQQTLPLYHQLTALEQEINSDPALENALALTDITLEWLDPSLRLILKQQNLQPKKKIQAEQFYLYPPKGATLPEPSEQLEGKTFAIVNDNLSVLQVIERDFRLGVLFPHAKLITQGDAHQFLNSLDYSKPLPDIIFTDIQLADGGTGSGYYLAYMLRKRGYTGGIIALTSYQEDEVTALQFINQGFDGFISFYSPSLVNTPLSVRLTQAAQVYLQKQAEK